MSDSLVRAMPHALGFEKSVLSSMMQHTYLMDEVHLTEEHFYVPGHQVMFAEMLAARDGKDQIDLTTFVQRLLDKGRLEAAGGASCVYDIFTYAPHPGSFHKHVEGLRDKMARRLAIRAGVGLQEAAYDESNESFLDAAGEPITAVHEAASGASSEKTMREMLAEFTDEFARRVKGTAQSGVMTSLRDVNNHLRGLMPNRYIIISGYPSSGKSLMAQQLELDAALEWDVPCLYVSAEMSDMQVIERGVCYVSGLDIMAITEPAKYAAMKGKAALTTEELKAVATAHRKLAEAPFHVKAMTGPRVSSVIAVIRKHVRKHGVRIVTIDYAQLVRGTGKEGTKEQEMAHVSHELQALQKELGLTLILLSQQNQQGGTKYAEVFLEDADTVLSLQQKRVGSEDEFPTFDVTGAFIRKARHEGTAGQFIHANLNKQKLRFLDAAYASQERTDPQK